MSNQLKKMTPAQKIASVKIEQGKDNYLPPLNQQDLLKIGITQNKPIVVKREIIARNATRHPDVSQCDINQIIAQSLYNPTEIFKGNKEKPYYTFVKPLRLANNKNCYDNAIVLLDIDDNKPNFEVVHWHWMSTESLARAKKRGK